MVINIIMIVMVIITIVMVMAMVMAMVVVISRLVSFHQATDDMVLVLVLNGSPPIEEICKA